MVRGSGKVLPESLTPSRESREGAPRAPRRRTVQSKAVGRMWQVACRFVSPPSTYDLPPTGFPAILPEGPHPFPSRTRQLSPPGPMVLAASAAGRVGRRRIKIKRAVRRLTDGLFDFGSRARTLSFRLVLFQSRRKRGASPDSESKRFRGGIS